MSEREGVKLDRSVEEIAREACIVPRLLRYPEDHSAECSSCTSITAALASERERADTAEKALEEIRDTFEIDWAEAQDIARAALARGEKGER